MISYTKWGNELYSGTRSYPIVKFRKAVLAAGAFLIALSIAAVGIAGINPGIEFTGGTQFTITNTGNNPAQQPAYDALAKVGVTEGGKVYQLGTNGLRVQSQKLNSKTETELQDLLAKAYDSGNKNAPTAIDKQSIGPTWGTNVSRDAIRGLVVFLLLVGLMMTIYFRTWTMSVAALTALAHDFFITIGVFALLQAEITPATVIGFLTILGYSLYDTVVVFDKIRENTTNMSAQSRYRYDDLVNLSINQTMVRSINTSVVALLPVAAILFLGSWLLGAGTLRDIALPLFIGMIVGTFSSIFIASPLLTVIRNRQKDIREHNAKVEKAKAKLKVDAEDIKVGASDISPRVAPLSPGEHLGQVAQPKRKKKK